ncbi:PQQ-dependent sugar dehydrogenase [Herpetosiphon gulosus]|uniref:DUF7133 domain-containing protein n=1 Tax=Herpetosiphon gulosus TaxID=1973496 RepID=A0ABP9X1I0_9CHLR
MLLNIATLVLLSLWLGAMIGGLALMRQAGRWRWIGLVIAVQGLILLVFQGLLSTYPIGIGDPLIRVKFWDLLSQAAVVLGALAVVAVVLWWLAKHIRYSIDQQLRRRGLALFLLLGMPLIATPAFYTMWQTSIPERERERNPDLRAINLPEGFEWSIYARGTMDNPTAIAFGAENELYIADIAGDLWIGRDQNNDQQIDSLSKWAGDFDLLVGLVWRDGELYCASSGKIEALRDSDGDGVADSRRIVVDNLPSMILQPHSNNGLAFGPDGRLYFGVGSTTDGKFEENELAASILSVNPDGTDLRPYARGLGNVFDVAFNADGALFGGDNGPSSVEGNDPPDEFNYLVEGEHYGYPYFFGDPPSDGGTRGALISFPAHTVPTGVTFYSGNQYPQIYSDSAFLTLWQTGEVVHIEVGQTSNGDYLAKSTTFADGMLYPIDVITGPDGNLYIADFGTSAIYRITYNGAR